MLRANMSASLGQDTCMRIDKLFEKLNILIVDVFYIVRRKITLHNNLNS